MVAIGFIPIVQIDARTKSTYLYAENARNGRLSTYHLFKIGGLGNVDP